MSTVALGSYVFGPRDTVEKFPAPLLYISWDEHMMFPAALALPMPPSTTFEQLIAGVLPQLYGQHPDLTRVDWSRAQWFRGHEVFTPRMKGSLQDHGFKHKSVLRFRTPGLEGIRGSCG